MIISRVKDGSNIQIIEDAIRKILSHSEMFNSKDIQKNGEQSKDCFIRFLNYQKIERYGIFIFISNSVTQTFKSSDGSQRKMGEGVQSCKLEQCKIYRWSSILRRRCYS